MSLQRQLMLLIGPFMLLAFVGPTLYIHHVDMNQSVKETELVLRQTALRRASDADSFFARLQQIPNVLAAGLARRPPSGEEEAYGLLEDAFSTSGDAFGGTVAYEPGGFEPGRRHFSPYVSRAAGGGFDRVMISPETGAYDYFLEDWYAEPKRRQAGYWTRPYFDEGAGNTYMSTYGAPFFPRGGGEVAGVVTIDAPTDEIVGRLLDVADILNPRAYAVIVDREGRYIAHPDMERVRAKENLIARGTAAAGGGDARAGWEALALNLERGEPWQRRMRSPEGARGWVLACGAPIEATDWQYIVITPEEEILAPIRRRLYVTLGAMSAFLAALFALTPLFIRRFLAPLHKAVGLAVAIRDGDYSVRAAEPRKDETGELIAALNGMAARLAARDEELHRRLDERNGILEHVTTATGELNRVANQVAVSAQASARDADEQKGMIEAFQKTIERLEADAGAYARDAGQAAGLVREAQEGAREGDRQMTRMNDSAGRLAATVTRIGSIVGNIDGIAFQTRLLSLNAAIEAARAGRAGQGFAVVADEVRTLAEHSATSAHESAELLKEARLETVEGVEQGRLTGERLAESLRAMDRLAQTMGLIAGLSAEQLRTLAGSAGDLGRLRDLAGRNAGGASANASAAAQLLATAARFGDLLASYASAQAGEDAPP